MTLLEGCTSAGDKVSLIASFKAVAVCPTLSVTVCAGGCVTVWLVVVGVEVDVFAVGDGADFPTKASFTDRAVFETKAVTD